MDLRIKQINPVVDDNGKTHEDWVKTIVVDENENEVNYKVIQTDTGVEFFEPIDLYPCNHTYEVGSENIEETQGEQEDGE